MKVQKRPSKENPVTIAGRLHLFPSRTQKLSSLAPMILGGKLPGKVGRCRFFLFLFYDHDLKDREKKPSTAARHVLLFSFFVFPADRLSDLWYNNFIYDFGRNAQDDFFQDYFHISALCASAAADQPFLRQAGGRNRKEKVGRAYTKGVQYGCSSRSQNRR